MFEPQLPETLQDAGDAQIVVHVSKKKKKNVEKQENLRNCESHSDVNSPLQVSKALLPVVSPFDFTVFSVDQLDAVEAQHEFVRLHKSPFGIFVVLKGLRRRKKKI